MSELDHLRKKPPDGGLLLDVKDRKLRAQCRECGVHFTSAMKKHHSKTSERRHVNLRRSINAAKKKIRRLEETDEAREAPLQDDRVNKESKRRAESEGMRTVRLQKASCASGSSSSERDHRSSDIASAGTSSPSTVYEGGNSNF